MSFFKQVKDTLTWKSWLTHLWTSLSLVAWHCVWTKASKSAGIKGRPADKRSLRDTNLKDEKLKNQTKKHKLVKSSLSYFFSWIYTFTTFYTVPFQPNILQEDHNLRNGKEMTFNPRAIRLVCSFPRYWCTDDSSGKGDWDIRYGQSLAFRRVQQDIINWEWTKSKRNVWLLKTIVYMMMW